jgi:hypothetical protein
VPIFVDRGAPLYARARYGNFSVAAAAQSFAFEAGFPAFDGLQIWL